MRSTETVVGVRELRSRLSAYLREVARGGIVTVGDRSRTPVARLVPAVPSGETEHLADLAAHGLVQLGSGKPGSHRLVKPQRRGRTAAEIVLENRR